MIPILFDKSATTFTTNGLGRLPDCIRCQVTEERNGVFELELEYPVTGINFGQIQVGQIIASTHDEAGDIQPFDIYMISQPMDGIVTVYAHHISYRLNEIVVEPFTATTCANAIAGLKTNSIGTNQFTFSTNKSVTANYSLSAPAALRGLLGGEENSLLDVYGTGEYKFDKFSVSLLTHRGTDTDVSIRYGKNLVDFENEIDYSNSYNAVVPFWQGMEYDENTGEGTDVLVTLPEKYLSSNNTLPSGRTVYAPLDLSDAFEEKPTVAQLRSLATTKLANSDGWLPSQNIAVDFIQLWQTEEYKDYVPLQRVGLCDTVLVSVPMYDIANLRIKVVKVVWNALLDRYDKMELGNLLTSYAALITSDTRSAVSDLENGLLMVQGAATQAIANATEASTAAITAQAAASDAIQAAENADQAVHGTYIYRYDNHGTIETVYKRPDGTYYYLYDGVAIDVSEEDLEHDEETGELIVDNADDGLDTLVQQASDYANEARTNAATALEQADAARTSATTANSYANAALTQLGVVENVVGVLDLLQKNGEYGLTDDPEVEAGKWYFTRSGSGTSADPYIYAVVNNPSGDPSAQGWYELIGIDEAIQNYVSSHIALDEQGLWLQTSGVASKVLLSATDGVVLYGTNGSIVGKYGDTAQIGDSAGFNIKINGAELGFYQVDRKVAYISNNQLYITQSVVLEQMDLGRPYGETDPITGAQLGFGQWSWKVHKNGENPSRNNLNLKWVG